MTAPRPPLAGPLDYAAPSPRSGRVPASGVCAVVAMAAQYPWVVLVFTLAWADRGPTGTGPTTFTSAVYFVAALLPTVLGVTLGIYSLRVAGVSRRNACGVIALLLVAAEALLVAFAVLRP